MNRKIALVGAIVAGVVLVAAAWYGWQWYTTPPIPDIPLDGAEPLAAKAIDDALRDVRRAPRSGEAWGKLGMVLAAHDIGDPEVCYANAERFDPDSPRWPYLRGLYWLNADPQRAVPLLWCSLALAKAPEHRTAILYRLATVLIENGHLDEAEEHLNTLRALDLGSRAVYGFGLLATAREDLPKARQLFSSLAMDPTARQKATTQLALLADDRDTSDFYLRQAKAMPPDIPWPDPFEEELKQAKVNRMQRIESAFELDRQGRYPEAIAFLRNFVAQSPDAESYALLGFLLVKTGQYEDALDPLRAALGYNPRDTKARMYLGLAHLRIGEKQLKSGGKESAASALRKSIEVLDEALAKQRDMGYAHLYRGLALKHLGRTDEAIQALRQAVLCQSEAAEMHLALGEALAESGQLQEGLESLENAVQLAPPDDPRPREARDRWREKAKKRP